MDLLARLAVVAVLTLVGAVLTSWYRRRTAEDEAIGATDDRGASLWPDLPTELRGESVDSHGRPTPTWVIFTTPLCVSCTAVQADLERSFAHHAVRKVDATEQPDVAELYGVRRAPTTILVDAMGRVVERLVGPEAVRDFIGTVDEAALRT